MSVFNICSATYARTLVPASLVRCTSLPPFLLLLSGVLCALLGYEPFRILLVPGSLLLNSEELPLEEQAAGGSA